jgi:hypothetical protein
MGLLGALVVGLTVAACGAGTVPRPSYVQVLAEDYVQVPFSPRPPPVEIVPPRPADPGGLVWADGGWTWGGERFRWEPGAWVVPPPGARRARWVIVRRVEDGQLFFAASSWRDAAGKLIDAPKPLVKATIRPGAGAGDVTSPSPATGARTDMDE